MQNVYVKFNSLKEINQFVAMLSNYQTEFDLVSRRNVVDAKSLLGICSLDLSTPLLLNIYSDDPDIPKSLENFLSPDKRQGAA